MKKYAYIWVIMLISMVGAFVITLLNKCGRIKSGLEILPHIITIDSIILGLVTLTLTIMMTIRDGAIYRKAKERNPDILTQVYGYSTAALVASMLSVLLSIWILLTRACLDKSPLYKSCCVFFSTMFFIFMIISVTISYSQSIQLLRLDDEG